MNKNSPVAIIALLAEMARCLNENMAKVKLTPIDPALSGSLAATTAAMSAPPAGMNSGVS